MNCPKNKKHKVMMVEDMNLYDGISFIYCYDCKKLYDRWTKEITKDRPDIVDSLQ